MAPCCPPGRGCNAPDGGEPCALTLFSDLAGDRPEAAQALTRWRSLVSASDSGCGEREKRFRRRAFERARDKALIALAMGARPTVRVRGHRRRSRGRAGIAQAA
jgi:hypothetical protein